MLLLTEDDSVLKVAEEITLQELAAYKPEYIYIYIYICF